MAFDKTKPAIGGPLSSTPVRDNLNALAVHHAGPSQPVTPDEGYVWLDTSNPSRKTMRLFVNGAWCVQAVYDSLGNLIIDGGTF